MKENILYYGYALPQPSEYLDGTMFLNVSTGELYIRNAGTWHLLASGAMLTSIVNDGAGVQLVSDTGTANQAKIRSLKTTGNGISITIAASGGEVELNFDKVAAGWGAANGFATLDGSTRVVERLSYEGIPNGVATLDADGNVVERLSYEGVPNGVATLDANGKIIDRLAYEGVAGGVATLDDDGLLRQLPITNVRQHGAVGDGQHDDTAAIQAALDSGAAAVLIPAGTYLTSAALVIPNDVALIGVGRPVIRAADGSSHNIIQQAYRSRWRLEGVVLDGNRANRDSGHLLLMSHAADAVITGVNFINSPDYGVWGYDAPGLRITGNVFVDNKNDIYVDGAGNGPLYIAGNKLTHPAALPSVMGIYVRNATDVVITGNAIDGVGVVHADGVNYNGSVANGIQLSSVVGGIVSNNRSTGNDWSGLLVGSGNVRITVTGNLLGRGANTSAAAWVEQGPEHVSLTGNELRGMLCVGDNGARYLSVVANIITTNGYRGVDVNEGATRGVFADNTIINLAASTSDEGLFVWSHDEANEGLLIRGNVIRGFARGIYLVNPGGTGEVRGVGIVGNLLIGNDIGIATGGSVTLGSDCVVANNIPNDNVQAVT